MFIRPRIDTTATMIPWKTMCIWFFGALGFMAFMLWVGAKYPSYMPAVRNEMGQGENYF